MSMIESPTPVRQKPWLSLALIRQWHWMSAALCFTCMLLFAITGITLHHSRDWLPAPSVSHITGEIPDNLRAPLSPLPEHLIQWFAEQYQLQLTPVRAEQREGKWIFNFSRPGKSITLKIAPDTGHFDYEINDRGLFGLLNDLHKGKSTGKAWVYLTDLFAIAVAIFSVSGFWLLLRYTATRAQTWPLVIAGLVIPLGFIAFMLHP